MSGGLNPINLVSQIALAAATGGTSIIAQMAIKLATEIAAQVIQQLGDQLGLPQPMIDAAQGALRGATGDFAGAAAEYTQAAQGVPGLAQSFGEQLGASRAEISGAQQELEQTSNDWGTTLSQSEEFKAAKSGGTRSGGSWLMALAISMGKMLDAKAEEIQALSETMTDKTPSATAKFGAANQEFGLMMNATNNALKTIGEALSTMARKG